MYLYSVGGKETWSEVNLSLLKLKHTWQPSLLFVQATYRHDRHCEGRLFSHYKLQKLWTVAGSLANLVMTNISQKNNYTYHIADHYKQL